MSRVFLEEKPKVLAAYCCSELRSKGSGGGAFLSSEEYSVTVPFCPSVSEAAFSAYSRFRQRPLSSDTSSGTFQSALKLPFQHRRSPGV